MSASATSGASPTQIVEHVVLFKVTPNADPSEVAGMVNGLVSLSSLHQVLHLTAAPINRLRSSSPLTFTHFLHIRFQSSHDLHSYSIHPAHVEQVNKSRPIIEDIMAVDWVSENPPPVSVDSAMRFTFFKVGQEGEGERNAGPGVLGEIGAVKERFDCISYGENFSVDRSKGFSIGSVLIFDGLKKMEAAEDLYAAVKEKVGEGIQSVLVVDHVPPVTE